MRFSMGVITPAGMCRAQRAIWWCQKERSDILYLENSLPFHENNKNRVTVGEAFQGLGLRHFLQTAALLCYIVHSWTEALSSDSSSVVLYSAISWTETLCSDSSSVVLYSARSWTEAHSSVRSSVVLYSAISWTEALYSDSSSIALYSAKRGE